MNKCMKTVMSLFAVLCLSFCFLFNSSSFGQALPKPGEVIDKSNYKNYAHLIPKEFLAGFEDGWGGYWKPISMKVVETKSASQPKEYLVYSEKNTGKYTLDKDGFIAGGYNYEGLPFPGVTPADKEFATKIMWNFVYRYQKDDMKDHVLTYFKRKGEPVNWNLNMEERISFVNRMFEDPKPKMDNPLGLEKAEMICYLQPPNIRNFQLLGYRYCDPKKPDDLYLYLPAMRRCLRAEASQRSVPVQGSTQAMDDFYGCDVRVPEFTYQYVGEQKVMAVLDSPLTEESAKKLHAQTGNKELPWLSDNWEVRDAYVLDVIPKDPKYPQSKKRIYLDKEALSCLYAVAWDRANALWKIWVIHFSKRNVGNAGSTAEVLSMMSGFDMQFGFASWMCTEVYINKFNLDYAEFKPESTLNRGR